MASSDTQVHRYDYVKVKDLPSFSSLNSKVQAIVKRSSWWELYGVDWMYNLVAFLIIPLGLVILKSSDISSQVLGIFMLGIAHPILTVKSGHSAEHGSLAQSPAVNKFWSTFFVEFIGSFSAQLGYDIHVRDHHPHTNIIGLGDSSSWKAPYLSCVPYMFFGPLLLPLMTPFVAISQLVQNSMWKHIPKYLIVMLSGYAFHIYLLTSISGYSFLGAVLLIFTYRAVFAIPYIHVNIFQHIGLPMWAPEDRPARIYQMSNGVLNLYRHPILDHVFGHSIVNCHVEHHLFPRLSDNMCLKIKDIVREHLTANGLPYYEKPYFERLSTFVNKYDELMVKAPPITHFVGLQ